MLTMGKLPMPGRLQPVAEGLDVEGVGFLEVGGEERLLEEGVVWWARSGLGACIWGDWRGFTVFAQPLPQLQDFLPLFVVLIVRPLLLTQILPVRGKLFSMGL